MQCSCHYNEPYINHAEAKASIVLYYQMTVLEKKENRPVQQMMGYETIIEILTNVIINIVKTVVHMTSCKYPKARTIECCKNTLHFHQRQMRQEVILQCANDH